MVKKLSFLILTCWIFVSCEESPAVLNLNIQPEVDGSAWSPDVAFTTNGTDQAKVDLLQFYLSNVTLKKADGSEELVDETFFLNMIDGPKSLSVNVPQGDYTSICFSIGVPENKNLDNPAQYAEDHPLSIRRNMHWSWSVGYIFAMIEGDWDSTGTGNFDKIFLYHPGTSGLYRTLCFEEEISVSNEKPLDLSFIFEVPYLIASPSDTLNLSTDFFTHSTPVGSDKFELAERVMNNMASEAIHRP